MNEKKLTALISVLAFGLAGMALVPVGMNAGAEQTPLSQANEGTDHCEEFTEEVTLQYPTETYGQYFIHEFDGGELHFAVNYGIAALTIFTPSDTSANQNVKVTIPAEIEGYPVQYIGKGAFKNKTMVSEIIMPDTIISIGEEAFENCTLLSEVSISQNLAEIPNRAFKGCTSLKSVEFPENISVIGNAAFENCTSLENISLPQNAALEMNSFCNTGLKEIIIPSGTKLKNWSFSNCEKLCSVTINSTMNIMDPVFYGCTSLADIYFQSSVDVWNSIYDASLDYPLNSNTKIHCTSYANINGDRNIDAEDASIILNASALAGSGTDSGLTEQQISDADVNFDGTYDAQDAATILRYAAAFGTGEKVTLADFLQ